MINLGNLLRPNSTAIFARDPVSLGKVVQFLLTNSAIPVPGRVRLDLTKSIGANKRYAVTRNPVQRAVADNILAEPETIVVAGSLSATPLGLINTGLGVAGSVVRRDLIEVRKLRELADKREPVVLVLPIGRTLTSVALTNIQEQHVGTNKVDLVLTFEEITIVSPIAVAGLLALETALMGAGQTENIGSQPSTAVAEPAGIGGGLG